MNDDNRRLSVLENALDALVLSLAASGFDLAGFISTVRERANEYGVDDYLRRGHVKVVAEGMRRLAEHFEGLMKSSLVEQTQRRAAEQLARVAKQQRQRKRQQRAAAAAGWDGPEELGMLFP